MTKGGGFGPIENETKIICVDKWRIALSPLSVAKTPHRAKEGGLHSPRFLSPKLPIGQKKVVWSVEDCRRGVKERIVESRDQSGRSERRQSVRSEGRDVEHHKIFESRISSCQ
jgi:hypothetical protein